MKGDNSKTVAWSNYCLLGTVCQVEDGIEVDGNAIAGWSRDRHYSLEKAVIIVSVARVRGGGAWLTIKQN